MKKSVLLISLVFFLTSCQAMTSSESTATPAPANTTTPAATSMIEPTSTSVPPTLVPTATLVNIDFEMPASFAPYENQFPLTSITETNGYLLRCAFDTSQIERGTVSLSSEVEMRAWVKCYFHTTDKRTDYVIAPIYVVNQKTGKQFMPFYSESQDLPPGGHGYSTKALEKVVPEWLNYVTGTDQPKIVVFGIGFGSTLSSTDSSQQFFRPVIEKINASDLDKFSSTGDTGVLINIGTLSHYLPAYDYLYDMFK